MSRTQVIRTTRVLIFVVSLSLQLIAQKTDPSDQAAFMAEIAKARKGIGGSAIQVEAEFASKGSIEAQRKILCDLEFSRDAADRHDGLQALRITGGWFAIHTFATYLANTPENTLISSPRDKHSDVRFLGRRYYALKFLSELLPNAPFHPTESELLETQDHLAGQWSIWIKDHEATLSTLKPSSIQDVPSASDCKTDFGKYQKYK